MSRHFPEIVQPETFGHLVKRLREERSMPQRKLAALLDIDSSTLSKIERGERHPSLGMIAQLSAFFQVSEEDLLVAYLSDRIVSEVEGHECVGKALEAAQEKARQRKLIK